MKLAQWTMLLLVSGCDPAALAAPRDNRGLDEEMNKRAEAQRAEQAAGARESQSFAQGKQREYAERRAREDQEKETQRQATAERVKSHAENCAATYRARFIDMQKAMEDYPAARAKMVEGCKRLATHCATVSGGPSVCRGLMGNEQAQFDNVCRPWPNYRIVPEDDQECADVDPETLLIDFSWSPQNAADFRKRTPPPR